MFLFIKQLKLKLLKREIDNLRVNIKCIERKLGILWGLEPLGFFLSKILRLENSLIKKKSKLKQLDQKLEELK